ncbi:hypothetical protein GCM10012275_57020 [Longimycelium tulufanense]|uniref:Uncharacterized protein n=1 Tax=Longimycelium tulufanense TaxID=907463 RepID=A0A8J3CDT4_9PSEU|nr:SRPBCC family protein [Longimycelium tulufanense]GGM78983.1 hypothetical protein GCM10012275_57020 [Longimycelium tulufanense]
MTGETNLSTLFSTSWELSASAEVLAPAERLYTLVSDVTRMGEWSPECTGGEWISGEPGRVGSRFHGHNKVGEQTWTTECEVVSAEHPHRFTWVVLASPADREILTWSFEIESNGASSRLTQRHRMRSVPPPLRATLEKAGPERAPEVLQRRREMLQEGIRRTVARLKAAAENS